MFLKEHLRPKPQHSVSIQTLAALMKNSIYSYGKKLSMWSSRTDHPWVGVMGEGGRWSGERGKGGKGRGAESRFCGKCFFPCVLRSINSIFIPFIIVTFVMYS